MPVLPFGACLVAEAAERAGHRVSFLDLMFAADPLRAIKEVLGGTNFAVIGLSVRNIDNIDMGAPRCFVDDLSPLIAAVRRLTDAPLVLGGAALMVMPELIMRKTGVPCAVIGDGEIAFPRLVEKLGRNQPWADLPGIASLVGGTYRAHASAPGLARPCAGPDYGRWLTMRAYRSHLSTIPLQTKSGCLFQCVYCTYPMIEGAEYRLSDPESVAETTRRYAAAGFRDIEFVDNVFNAPYDHALAVCESLIRSRNRARLQSIEMNPVPFDQRLLSAMERAGFVGIGLTVESAADPVLEGLRKGFTAREVHAAAEVVKRSRLPCLWIFLLGGPGETRETVRETLRFAERFIRPQDAAIFNIGIRIYPGTELEAIARRQGLLSLPAAGMLAPVFYVSPEVHADWVTEQVQQSMNGHMNFMNAASLSVPYLPRISRLGHRLGLKPPLWRYTRFIRSGLRAVGMRV
ncbi:MAG: B12-binding domain-containing radical SAM protein [Candidatus Geothermincolia bacterium]